MPDATDALIRAADAAMRGVADPERAPAMAAYMKTDDPFYGVTAPQRREVLRQLVLDFRPASAAQYQSYVQALSLQPHRESRYLSLDLAQRFKKFITPDALPLFEDLVRRGAWWDLVDPVAANLLGKLLLDHRAEMTPVIRDYIEDDHLWIRRTAIIAQIKHREATDGTMLFEFCMRTMHEKDFFIRKAIGWALRAYSSTAPDAVHAFLEEHRDNLAGLSYREGAKHLRRLGRME